MRQNKTVTPLNRVKNCQTPHYNDVKSTRTPQNTTKYGIQNTSKKTTCDSKRRTLLQNNSKIIFLQCTVQYTSKRCTYPQNNLKRDYLRCTVQYDSKQLKTGL